jgi:hypothetical protein
MVRLAERLGSDMQDDLGSAKAGARRPARRVRSKRFPKQMLGLRWPGRARPEASLRLLAARGATPRQMLWGMWWCHAVPALCKSAAALVSATYALRVARLLMG